MIAPIIHKLSSDDKHLLQQAILRWRPNSKKYEDSWGYIIQATRHGGFTWFNPDTDELIFFGRKSETDLTLVVPNFFADPKSLIAIIKHAQNELGNSKTTILKNVNIKDIHSFVPYGFRPYQEHEYWSEEARFDDQTYPQLIINLKKLHEAIGSRYENLRASLRKTSHVALRDYVAQDRTTVLNIFALKDEKRTAPQGMYISSHAMYPDSDTEKRIIFDTTTNEILGFTATSDISPTIFALVASGFHSDKKSISIWGIYQTLMEKMRQGYLFSTMGGCEFESTYRFKREKFRPVEEIIKTHLVYDNKF